MKVVFFTGAGISAESGIKTFRDHNGLWEGHDLMKVAHIDAWDDQKNRLASRERILNFYNQRRAQLKEVLPNNAHITIARFQEKFPNTSIVTQNVDDLHERAGSTNIIHLHGELKKVKSELDSKYVLDWENDLTLLDKCPSGGQLRPAIVWFGEDVPNYEKAYYLLAEADIIVSIGTSGVVEPAASLFFNANHTTRIIINPKIDQKSFYEKLGIILIEEKASTGIEKAMAYILNQS
jgi:NAD-dependent deacetylase